jgi:hypothetical protein
MLWFSDQHPCASQSGGAIHYGSARLLAKTTETLCSGPEGATWVYARICGHLSAPSHRIRPRVRCEVQPRMSSGPLCQKAFYTLFMASIVTPAYLPEPRNTRSYPLIQSIYFTILSGFFNQHWALVRCGSSLRVRRSRATVARPGLSYTRSGSDLCGWREGHGAACGTWSILLFLSIFLVHSLQHRLRVAHHL